MGMDPKCRLEINGMPQIATNGSTDLVKSRLEAARAILTILGILLGGWWFLMQDFAKPQVTVDHYVTQRPVAGLPGDYLVVIEVRATNTGKRSIFLKDGKIDILQVNVLHPKPPLPLKSDRNKLSDLFLNPGESDQAYFASFVFNKDDAPSLMIRTEYQVPWSVFDPHSWFKGNYWWVHRSFVDIGTPGTTGPAPKD
jgi:hypothetical protein